MGTRESAMRKPVSSVMILVLLAVPFVGGIAAVAYAADLCLTSGPFSLVVQDVGGGKEGKDINKHLGKANKCNALAAFFTSTALGANQFATATLCTSSDGSTVNVIASFFGGSMATQFPLPVPTSAGSSD